MTTTEQAMLFVILVLFTAIVCLVYKVIELSNKLSNVEWEEYKIRHLIMKDILNDREILKDENRELRSKLAPYLKYKFPQEPNSGGT